MNSHLKALLGTLALILASPSTLTSQSSPLAYYEAPEAAVRVVSHFASEIGALNPSAILVPATIGAADGLEGIRLWNEAGRLPTKNGFSRLLPLPEKLRVAPSDKRISFESRAGGIFSARSDGSWSWITKVRVENAYRLRLHLSDVAADTPLLFWVHSSNGESVGPFGNELVADGELWTPSVGGEEISLEVRIPESLLEEGGSPLFTLDRSLETFKLNEDGRPISVDAEANIQCLEYAACYNSNRFPAYDAATKAVAHMQYVKSGQGVICTGTLINDSDDSTSIPYFLTANHCISSQTPASTLETFWDYKASSCSGQPPALGNLPRTNGATLVATSPLTDFALLRLAAFPPGQRFLMGWSADSTETSSGRTLFRISHPHGLSQAYSETVVPSRRPDPCHPDSDGRPFDDLDRFVYQDKTVGATLGGSSGGASLNANGQIVGQLFGTCGVDGENTCSLLHKVVDGRFSATFPFVQPFIFGSTKTPCAPSATTACQLNGRFEITTAYDLGNGQTGSLGIDAYTDNAMLGYFNDPKNVEVIGKILKGCSINGFYWVAISGLTDREIVVQVRDTNTGATKVYFNILGNLFQPKFDLTAFPCN